MIKQYIILLTLLLAGCELGVTPTLWDRAEKACESHGGLKYYYATGENLMTFGFSRVICNDETEITKLPKVKEKVNE